MAAEHRYFYSKVDSLKVELLGAATKDAKRRAQEIANVSDIRVTMHVTFDME